MSTKFLPRTGHEGPEEEQMYSSTLPSALALDGGGWSVPHPGRFTPRKDLVPIVQKAGWAPGLVWTGAENFASSGIRFLDRPARSESLYQLSYPGPHSVYYLGSNLETDCFFSYISLLRLTVDISYGDISAPSGKCHKFGNFITIENVDENKVM